MIQRLLILMAILTLLLGCATQQPPTINFTSGTRIGIVNKMNASITHRHISTLRFDSFTKSYNVPWSIPDYTDDQLAQALVADSRYSVVLLQPVSSAGRDKKQNPPEPYTHATIDPGQYKALDAIDPNALSRRLRSNAADSLKAIADKNDLDVIIVVQSFSAESSFRLGDMRQVVQDYGLLTSRTIQRHAFSYANISIAAFATRPLTFIGSGRTGTRVRPLEGFNWQSDMKHIPPSELDRLRIPLQNRVDGAIKNALKNTNLL